MQQQLELLIPSDVENLQLPNPELLMYYKNLESRQLWIDFEINDGVIECVRQIANWNAEDKGVPAEERKPIKIIMHNYGGDLCMTWLMIDMINLSKTPVYTVAMNQCASGAGLIFMAGHRRFMLPNATVMIHQGSIATGEQDATKFMDMSESYKKILKKMQDYIISKTKIDSKVLAKKKANDWELDATFCLENGVCDEIVTDLDTIF